MIRPGPAVRSRSPTAARRRRCLSGVRPPAGRATPEEHLADPGGQQSGEDHDPPTIGQGLAVIVRFFTGLGIAEDREGAGRGHRQALIAEITIEAAIVARELPEELAGDPAKEGALGRNTERQDRA